MGRTITETVGHNDLLVSVWVILLVGLSIYLVGIDIGSSDLWVAGFVIALITELAATEVIYDDAKAINKAKGTKVLGATSWSLFAFFLAIIAVPLYSFSYRKTALSR
jgi:uncharacterized membrane protein YiaA